MWRSLHGIVDYILNYVSLLQSFIFEQNLQEILLKNFKETLKLHCLELKSQENAMGKAIPN